MAASRAGAYANRKYGTGKCQICSADFERRSSSAKVCVPCRPALKAAALERSADHRADLARGYYLASPEKAKARSRVRRLRMKQEDPEALKEKQRLAMKSWRDRNREKSRAYKAAYMRRRRQEPREAINTRIGNGIRISLGGAKGGKRWHDAVGYDTDALMRHLERQFLPGMSWANMSEWHVDHIRPLASFDFQTVECDGFRAAWALTNLRPMWAFDNMSKGAKIVALI